MEDELRKVPPDLNPEYYKSKKRIIPLKKTEIAAVIKRNQGADNKQVPGKLKSNSNRKVQKMQAKSGKGL